jgi:hypothetical protein
VPVDTVEMALATLVPLFVGSVATIHEMRGPNRDLGRSLRIAVAIWLGLGLGTVVLALALAILGFGT